MESEIKKTQNTNLTKESEVIDYYDLFTLQLVGSSSRIKGEIERSDCHVVLIPLKNFFAETFDELITCGKLYREHLYPSYCMVLRTLIQSVAKIVFMAFNTDSIINWIHHDNMLLKAKEQNSFVPKKRKKDIAKELKRRLSTYHFYENGWTKYGDYRPIYNIMQLFKYVGFDRFGDDFYHELNQIVHDDFCFANKIMYRKEETEKFLNKSVEVLAVLFNFLCRSSYDLKIITNKHLIKCSANKTALHIVPDLDNWWNNEIYDKRGTANTKKQNKKC